MEGRSERVFSPEVGGVGVEEVGGLADWRLARN
jgi:hypothetical protein